MSGDEARNENAVPLSAGDMADGVPLGESIGAVTTLPVPLVMTSETGNGSSPVGTGPGVGLVGVVVPEVANASGLESPLQAVRLSAPAEPASAIDVDRLLTELVDRLPAREAAKIAAAVTGLRRNDLYQRVLDLRNEN